MPSLTEQQSKHIRELLRSAKARRESGEFVIEGPHLLEVALDKAPSLITYCAFTAKAAEQYNALRNRAESARFTNYSIPQKLAERMSDTEEPQGIFAVLKLPTPRPIAGDLILALDAVQDPGNVGTIIRTAAWFGVSTFLLGEGTADPFAPKVVRSTQGAIFEVSLEAGMDLRERLQTLKQDGWQIAAMSLEHESTSIYDVPFAPKTVVLLGSEAHGISKDLLRLADHRIIIPRFGSGESLNVASSAAIVLAEMRRRQA